ncbi:MAG: alpha-L-arabinofuranosidase, partial [Clostridia bacterium]|nr:alpha-L-arabinofuranosidase [Clostridia bacterium]
MKITIDPTQKGHDLGNLFGLFFEDLNHAADGGLYAELVQNRDFEFDPVDHADYTPLTAWNPVGNASIKVFDSGSPFPNTPRYGAVSGLAGEGMENLGYGDGIPVKEGIPIRLTLWAKSDSCCSLSVSLAGDSVRFKLSASWDKYEALLTPTRTGHTERVTLTLGEDGAFDLAFLSLMPTDGWPGQANMLRRDIAQALADMKPHFLRFPGGCLTHDGVLDPDARDGIYNWKKTIGPVENRPPRRNNWKYHQTLGLGFYEYFLFCEDIGAEPLPVVCGGLDPHHLRFAEGEVLERYIQDAADLVEFANGSADTHWGSVRASLGHP